MGANNEGETPQNDNNSDISPQKESDGGFEAKHNQELEDIMTVEEEHAEAKLPLERIEQARLSFFGPTGAPDSKEKKTYVSVMQELPKPYDCLFCLSNVGVANPSRDECYLELNTV